MEGLIATKPELERQLLDINKDINKLIGKKVAESVFIREFNEHSLCQKCKLVTPLVRSGLCYLCCWFYLLCPVMGPGKT